MQGTQVADEQKTEYKTIDQKKLQQLRKTPKNRIFYTHYFNFSYI